VVDSPAVRRCFRSGVLRFGRLAMGVARSPGFTAERPVREVAGVRGGVHDRASVAPADRRRIRASVTKIPAYACSPPGLCLSTPADAGAPAGQTSTVKRLGSAGRRARRKMAPFQGRGGRTEARISRLFDAPLPLIRLDTSFVVGTAADPGSTGEKSMPCRPSGRCLSVGPFDRRGFT
jgi:hypothetical protein